MSMEILLRCLFSGIMSLGFAMAVSYRHDEAGNQNMEQQKYIPYIPGSLLPTILLALTILYVWGLGAAGAARMMLSFCFVIFLQISGLYLVLLLILPWLRKHISARACAILWMLPNYLYFLGYSFMKLPEPRWVIPLPGKLIWVLMGIWLVGFAGVLLWKVIGHLRLRHHILLDAVPVTDPLILDVWKETVTDSRIKKPRFRLVTSPRVTTPLTIGLFKRTTRVILPERSYTREELALILRHEIVHISREDAWNKFFLVFCTAMCWFNPLMWLAMGKCADDIELSCDETVLLDADDATRKQYAQLLLNTAGDQRGFTTCLSASARAMRYRLRSVAQPVKRRSGALIVGTLFFLMCMTSGYVALAYEGDAGAKVIYQNQPLHQFTVRNFTLVDDPFSRDYRVTDEAALHQYLSGLTLYELTGNYSHDSGEKSYSCMVDTPQGVTNLQIFGHGIRVVPLYGPSPTTKYYHVPGGVDLDYLETLVFEFPAMNIHILDEGHTIRQSYEMLLHRLWKVEEGASRQVYESDHPAMEDLGLFTRAPYPVSATFQSSYELAAPMTVLVESWDYSSSYTVTQADPESPFTMELPEYPAHYTVLVRLRDQNGSLYEAEFWYNIGDVNG